MPFYAGVRKIRSSYELIFPTRPTNPSNYGIYAAERVHYRKALHPSTGIMYNELKEISFSQITENITHK